MDEVQPAPGDKVRVTSIVDKNGRYGGRAAIEDGAFGATLEIVERADDPSRDPSRDPIGTIRGDRYIRLADYNRNGDWWDLRTQNWTGTPPATEPVTSAVPGTPADMPKLHATLHAESPFEEDGRYDRKPLVVQYGDPEPDRSKRFHTPHKATVEMGTFGWRLIELNGDATINVPWSGIPERHFPLTEVVVEP